MSKVFFCPYCDKYIDNSYFCPFCSSHTIFPYSWNKKTDEEKEAWMKDCPQPNPPQETFKRESARLRAIDFDKDTRRRLAEEARLAQYKPTCPVCHCPDLEKISGFDKTVDIAVWGVWSRKAHKQFRCKACGYEF